MFGEKLKAIREKRELSQRQLAKLIGRHQPVIARIELNYWDPSYGFLKDLVEKAKVKPSELF